jgi:hypothetical protein
MVKLNAFKQLLLKKINNNEDLSFLVESIDDNKLFKYAVESLSKAAHDKVHGKKASSILARWGTQMNMIEPHMVYDGLSHHASHYKAALKNGDTDVADTHMKKIFDIVRLLQKSKLHSQDKMSYNVVEPNAWERTKYTAVVDKDHHRAQSGAKPVGSFTTDTRGFNYTGKDFNHMRQPKHDYHKNDIETAGHDGSYPLEEMSVTLPEVGKKHIHIEDVSGKTGYVPHVIDSHPIVSAANIPAKSVDHSMHENAWKDYRNFMNSDKVQNWAKSYSDKHETMGKTKSAPVHEKNIGTSKNIDASGLDPHLQAMLNNKQVD